MLDGTRSLILSLRGGALALLAVAMAHRATAADLNDYPTTARADYVYACMKSNGETRQVLDQCSCSIDVIASILPYERYVAAETALSLAQVPGRFGEMFRAPAAKVKSISKTHITATSVTRAPKLKPHQMMMIGTNAIGGIA